MRDLVPFVQFKKRENNHGGVLILVKLLASAQRITHVLFFLALFYEVLPKLITAFNVATF